MEVLRSGRPLKDGGSIPKNATDETPQIANARKRVTSRVKNFAKSIASAPSQLAQSMAPIKSFRKSEASMVTEASQLSLDDLEEDLEEDDSICSENFEDQGDNIQSSDNDEDTRLSVVMELSREWVDSELAGILSDDGDNPVDGIDDDDNDEELSIHTSKSGSGGSASSRATRLASNMGKVAVKMAKAPLNITKRLGTLREEDESHKKSPSIPSPQNSPDSSIRAPVPRKVVSKIKDVAVGISKVSMTIARVPQNIVAGMQHQSPTNTEKESSFVIRNSRPPLSNSASLHEGSLHSYLSPSTRTRSYRGGLLSEHSSGTMYSGGSSLSVLSLRPHSLAGSSGTSSSVSFDTSASTFQSKRSVFSSMGTMPSLASIASHDSIMDPGALENSFSDRSMMPSLASISDHDSLGFGFDTPSLRSKRSAGEGDTGNWTGLASIPQLDSTMTLDTSLKTGNSPETFKPGVTNGGDFYKLGVTLVEDNCAGTRLDELAPSVDILLNSKQPNKQQQRWAPECADRMLLSPQVIPVYSSRYSKNVKTTDNQMNSSAERMEMPLDLAPRAAYRRGSAELPALARIQWHDELPQQTESRTETIPLWSTQGFDSAPSVACRRTSFHEYAQSSTSHNSFTELGINTPAMTSTAEPELLSSFDQSSQKDNTPRATRRRSSSQNVVPLPTLLEDADTRNYSDSLISAAASAEVGESLDEDLNQDF